MNSPLARVVASCLEFLQVNLKAGMDPGSAQYVKFSWDATKTISTRLACIGKIPLQESASLIQLVDQGPMTAEGKATVIEVINSKVDMSCEEVVEVAKTSPKDRQTHFHMENYLTEAEWDQLLDAAVTFSAKLAVIAKRAN